MSISFDVHSDPTVMRTAREIALENFEMPGAMSFEPRERYRWLREAGSALWLDTGDADAAQQVWAAEVDALTTNSTLVNQVVQTGAFDGVVAYAAREIRKARPDMQERDLVIEVGFVVNARLALSLVSRFGARVSVELHPDLAGDAQRTVIFARRYYEICPEYFYIKIPLTPDGMVAARELARLGIPINLTVGFSARQNYFIARFARPAFVNVFLGRLNSLVEENHLGKPVNVGEKAALASSEAIRVLRETDPELPTRQIAASMRSGAQVPVLAGVDVLTIPPKVAAEYLAMQLAVSDIGGRRSTELSVELAPGVDLSELWEIDNAFIVFVEDAVVQANSMTTGAQLADLARKHDQNIFHTWTNEERAQIRERGKIPSLEQWPGIAVDDLMTTAALESFSADQMELDARVERLVREST